MRKTILTMLTALLFVSGAWAETVLKSIDFSDDIWNDVTFTQGASDDPETHNGVTFNAKNNSYAFSLSDGVLTFPNNNVSSGNYVLGFPVTGIVTNEITVKVYNGNSNVQVKYTIKDGGTTFSTSDCGSGTASSTANPVIIKKSVTNSSAYVYIGRTSTSYKTITKIEVTSPSLTDLTTSSFYQLYANSSATVSELVTAASFPSYILATISNATSGKLSEVPTITTPHDFSALNTNTKYYRLKAANTNTFIIEAVSRVKSIRLYGNGNGGTRSVPVAVTKVLGSGTAMSISNLEMANSNATIAEYSTGDISALSGYDHNTYYTYTITFPGNTDIWGIYVEVLNHDITIAKEYGWASMYLSYPVLVPTNCTAYYPKSTDVSGSYVTLTAYSSGSTIPKNTGVVVKDNTWDGTSDHTFSFAYSTASGTAAENNMLSGTVTEKSAASGDYVLSGDETTHSQCVFAPYGGSKLAAYKAYIPAANAPAAPSIRFIIEEENDATNLGNIESADEAVKFIQNGQLFIKKNGVVYDMMGRVIR